MPSGPPEWHEKWCKAGPTEGGDLNAITYLKNNGYQLTGKWTWIGPKDRLPTLEELNAIDYLIQEWDFGGFEQSNGDPAGDLLFKPVADGASFTYVKEEIFGTKPAGDIGDFFVEGSIHVTFCDDELLKTFLEQSELDEERAAQTEAIMHERNRKRWKYRGILFRHKKGGLYMRLFDAWHSETVERMTVYLHLWPHGLGLWVRPTWMFEEPERFRRIL